MIPHYFPTPPHRQGGNVKILGIVFVAIILIPLLIVGFHEGRKAYWDYRVRQMCEKDGGVKENETIDVDANTYEFLKNKFGQIDFPKKGAPGSTDSIAVHSYEDTYIRRSDPEVRRSKLIITRTSNGTVVATSTTYSRVGGDLFSLHPSHFSCPSAPNDFFASVINVKGGNK